MKLILPAESYLRTAAGPEMVGRLAAGIEIATLDGVSRVGSVRRGLPPRHSVVFDSGSLFPGGPSSPLRLGMDTLVGFRPSEGAGDVAAAASLVNGGSIRQELWPRRTEAVVLEVEYPVSLNGVWVSAADPDTLRGGAIWTGPSMLRWQWGTSDPNSLEFDRSGEDPISQQSAPVRLMSDGFWAEIVSAERLADDFIIRFAIPARARWVRVVSPALRPSGHAGNEADLRRFGVAITGLDVDGIAIGLDAAALVSGFYPIEGDKPRQWRWTDGSGLIVLEPSVSAATFSLSITNWHELLEV